MGEAKGRTTTPGVTANEAGYSPDAKALGPAVTVPETAAPNGWMGVPPGEKTGEAGTCRGDI